MSGRPRHKDDDLDRIYDRTNGRCHICHKKLAYTNYGMSGRRAAWEVEHSRAVARGGEHHMNNYYAACISCNRRKGTRGTRSARAEAGFTRAPLSTSRRKDVRDKNTAAGALAGGAIGAAFGGPPGALFCALIGAVIGRDVNPD